MVAAARLTRPIIEADRRATGRRSTGSMKDASDKIVRRLPVRDGYRT